MAGRPKSSFSDEQVQEMSEHALAGCQNNTISTLMDIPKSTLIRHFGKLLTKKRAERKSNLRCIQTLLAASNPAMAIFLGKNELEQVDKQEIRTEAVDSKPKSEQQLEAAKAGARAFNEAMSKTNIIPIKEAKNG